MERKKMKKIMTIVAAIMIAACSQAASVNWGAAVCMPDGVTAVPTGTMAYLLYSTTAFSAVSTFNTTDANIVSTHSITAYEASSAFAFNGDPFVRTDVAGGVNGYYRIAIVVGAQFAYLDSPQVTGLSDSTGAGDISINMGWTGSEFVGSNLGGTVVPEPTSMALLALGVAAIGLRRKFRA